MFDPSLDREEKDEYRFDVLEVIGKSGNIFAKVWLRRRGQPC